ncbi:hypothetical protein U1Q18_042493 [Sarracenia purpurea var. burkii]
MATIAGGGGVGLGGAKLYSLNPKVPSPSPFLAGKKLKFIKPSSEPTSHAKSTPKRLVLHAIGGGNLVGFVHDLFVALGIVSYLWDTPGVAPGFWDMFVLAFVERLFRPTYRKDDFVLGKKLGEGAFGVVYRVSLAKKPSSKKEGDLVLKKATEYGAVEIWMNERVRRACASSCADFLYGFLGTSSKKGGEYWLIWRFEGKTTLSDLMLSKDFPYNGKNRGLQSHRVDDGKGGNSIFVDNLLEKMNQVWMWGLGVGVGDGGLGVGAVGCTHLVFGAGGCPQLVFVGRLLLGAGFELVGHVLEVDLADLFGFDLLLICSMLVGLGRFAQLLWEGFCAVAGHLFFCWFRSFSFVLMGLVFGLSAAVSLASSLTIQRWSCVFAVSYGSAAGVVCACVCFPSAFGLFLFGLLAFFGSTRCWGVTFSPVEIFIEVWYGLKFLWWVDPVQLGADLCVIATVI